MRATPLAKSTGKRKTQPKASPSRIAERQRQQKALELRVQCKGFQEIADTLGYADRSGAFRAVMAVLDDAPIADAAKLRAEQSARLDAIINHMWKRLKDGDASAANSIIRAEERRAKLMGLDLDPKAAEMLQAALAAASASAEVNVFVINGEKKRVEDLTHEELDIVEGHLAGE